MDSEGRRHYAREYVHMFVSQHGCDVVLCMCLSSVDAVGAMACEGCQYQMREPLFYLQDKCVACSSLEDLQYILRLPLLREEDRLRAKRDLVLVVRDLR